MKPTATLGAYGLVLVAAMGGGAALGGVAGPIDVGASAQHATSDGGHPERTDLPAGGLEVSTGGYTFAPDDRLVDAGPFIFRITGPDGQPVTGFDVEHAEPLHLILASRDLTTFHHVHPTMDANGRWSVDLPELPAGSYRAFADFHPTGGEAMTLGVDLVAPGPVTEPRPLRVSAADQVDGYRITLDGQLVAGAAAEVAVSVTLDGEPVATAPYLGARGHLVALRDGDLAYLHVHPLDDDDGDGPVRFAVEVPSPGTYALFFDFLHDGEVRTARFVLDAGPGTEEPDPTADGGPPAHDDTHG